MAIAIPRPQIPVLEISLDESDNGADPNLYTAICWGNKHEFTIQYTRENGHPIIEFIKVNKVKIVLRLNKSNQNGIECKVIGNPIIAMNRDKTVTAEFILRPYKTNYL